MTATLSQNTLFQICSWMNNLPTGLSVSPHMHAIYLSHGMHLGLIDSVSKNHLAMQLIDMPVS